MGYHGPLVVLAGHGRVGLPIASKMGRACAGQNAASPSWWMWSSLS